MSARPVEQKKGADHGIDGKILFRDDPQAAKPEQIVIQVKGGKTGVKDMRDLRGVIDREKAAIGVLISLQPPTGPMEAEAASAGFYEHKLMRQKYPRLQLRTVKELMEGKGIERPSEAAAVDVTFKKAPKSKKKHGQQRDLALEEPSGVPQRTKRAFSSGMREFQGVAAARHGVAGTLAIAAKEGWWSRGGSNP